MLALCLAWGEEAAVDKDGSLRGELDRNPFIGKQLQVVVKSVKKLRVA